jgi:hypothetical protein
MKSKFKIIGLFFLLTFNFAGLWGVVPTFEVWESNVKKTFSKVAFQKYKDFLRSYTSPTAHDLAVQKPSVIAVWLAIKAFNAQTQPDRYAVYLNNSEIINKAKKSDKTWIELVQFLRTNLMPNLQSDEQKRQLADVLLGKGTTISDATPSPDPATQTPALTPAAGATAGGTPTGGGTQSLDGLHLRRSTRVPSGPGARSAALAARAAAASGGTPPAPAAPGAPQTPAALKARADTLIEKARGLIADFKESLEPMAANIKLMQDVLDAAPAAEGAEQLPATDDARRLITFLNTRKQTINTTSRKEDFRKAIQETHTQIESRLQLDEDAPERQVFEDPAVQKAISTLVTEGFTKLESFRIPVKLEVGTWTGFKTEHSVPVNLKPMYYYREFLKLIRDKLPEVFVIIFPGEDTPSNDILKQYKISRPTPEESTEKESQTD